MTPFSKFNSISSFFYYLLKQEVRHSLCRLSVEFMRIEILPSRFRILNWTFEERFPVTDLFCRDGKKTSSCWTSSCRPAVTRTVPCCVHDRLLAPPNIHALASAASLRKDRKLASVRQKPPEVDRQKTPRLLGYEGRRWQVALHIHNVTPVSAAKIINSVEKNQRRHSLTPSLHSGCEESQLCPDASLLYYLVDSFFFFFILNDTPSDDSSIMHAAY